MTAPEVDPAAVEAAKAAMHLHVCGLDAEFCNWTEEGDTCSDVDLSDMAISIIAAAYPLLVAKIGVEALEAITAAHINGDAIELAEAKMRWWWSEAQILRRERDEARAAIDTAVVEAKADALLEAADAIQALHPGEIKNSVTFLRERAAALTIAKEASE